MKLAIVSAMDEEISFLVQKFENVENIEINNFKFYLAKYHNLDLIISKSGVGKTAAGMLFATLNNNFEFDYVINTGICGGRRNHSNVGDVIVMDKCMYGDFSISAITNNAYGQLSGYPRVFESDRYLLSIAENAKIGDFMTSDLFMTSYDYTENIINNYYSDMNICGFDMESCAFAQCAYFFKKPFIAIRTTSDVVGSTSSDEYKSQEVDLCKLSCDYLFKYINLINNKIKEKEM